MRARLRLQRAWVVGLADRQRGAFDGPNAHQKRMKSS